MTPKNNEVTHLELTKKIRLVPMAETHLNELVKLEEACFPHPWTREALAEELRNPAAVFTVAMLGDRVAGYAGMQNIAGEGYVCNIAVFPQYRGAGIGRLLTGGLIRYARQNQLSFVTLEVRPSNIVAVSLYRSLGFAEEGRRPRFYRDPQEDALIMTWRPVETKLE